MKAIHTPPSPCPACLELLDTVQSKGKEPRPGDYTVCAYCEAPLRFGRKMELVKPPADELAADLAKHPELASSLAAQQRRSRMFQVMLAARRAARPVH